MYTSNTLVSSDGFQGGVATPPGETPPVLAPVLVVELVSLLLLLLLLLALTPLVSRDASREPIFPSVPVVAVVAVAVAVAVAALPSAILILSLFSGGGSSGGANSGGGGALCVPCTWYLLPSMYIYIYTLSLSLGSRTLAKNSMARTFVWQYFQAPSPMPSRMCLSFTDSSNSSTNNTPHQYLARYSPARM